MPENYATKSAQFNQPAAIEAVSYYEPDDLQQLKQRGRLYIVADGAWGTSAGNAASHYAVYKILHDYYHQALDKEVEKQLCAVIQKTNQNIYKQNQQNPERRPMGTTLMAALIHQNNLIIANVGDNQAHIVINEKKLETIGEPSTNALGLVNEVSIEVTKRHIHPNETIVLSNGGFRGYVTAKDLNDVITHNPPVAASRQLIRIAQQRGCRDNLAINIIEILAQDVSHTPPARVSPPEPITWEAVLALPQQRVAPLSSATTHDITSSNNEYTEEPDLPSIRWLWAVGAIGVLLLACIGIGSWLWSTMNASEGTQPIAVATETNQTSATEFIVPTFTPTLPATEASAAETSQESSDSGEPAPTEALAIDDLAAPPPTVAPTVTPTPSPTVVPTIALPEGCTNGARFLIDTSIPDGTEIVAGQRFEKAWSMTNNGTCPWGPGYTLRLVDGDAMQDVTQFDVPSVEPEVVTDVTVPLIAPLLPGRYRGTWQMHGLDGEPFGAEVSVEIEVLAPEPGDVVANPDETTLYDFVTQASDATWQSPGVATYQPQNQPIDADLVIPAPAGIVVLGPTELRGRRETGRDVLMTHPHQQTGSIEGQYPINIPLQPSDNFVATLGLPQVAIMNRDGAIFTVIFEPQAGGEPITLLSETITYQDSPQTYTVPLEGVPANSTGTFTLKVETGSDTNFDWALWIDARLTRPE